MNGADIQAAFAATLADEWARAGVVDAIVAPGSRSAPLLVALHNDGRFRLHSVLDERSAGFVALGLGAAGHRPAVVVTTSGTAAVELHPAVVEAHHAGVPLVAVTADRPPELHGVGAPQTVEQEQLFAGCVRFFAAPGVADAATSGAWRSLAARAVAAARGGPAGPGPVHLNLAFREPLLASDPAAAAALVPAGRGGGAPWHEVTAPSPGPPPGDLVAELAGVREGLIVAGAGAGDPAALLGLAEATGWPLLADPRSGARVSAPGVVGAADSLLRSPVVSSWHPRVVLRLGRPWASKVLNQWLAALPDGTRQLLVDPWGDWADPDRRVSAALHADPTATCLALAEAAGRDHRRGDGSWSSRWERAEGAAQAAITKTLEGGCLSEPALARAMVAAIPDGSIVFASSSMPVRDVEWFAGPRAGVEFLANRGANGIDGVLSSAVGASLARPGAPAFALVGDLAFLYDAGALLGLAERRADLTVVVADNRGGGIFSFLPQATALDRRTFERLFGTPQNADLTGLAAAYGVPAAEVGDPGALSAALGKAHTGPRVLVARVPDRETNTEVHQRLNSAVCDAVASLGEG